MAGLVGQQLQGGKYTVERELGRGRFGVTYLASDRKGNRLVIKTINENLLNQLTQPEIDRLQEKFWQEAVKLAQCKHPHIVRVKESFKEGQRVCIVMEYIEGKDLESYRKDGKIWTEKEALGYIRQIGSALMTVHNHDFVHRDVRPANIILRQGKPEAILIDFGLALGFDNPITTVNPTTADGFTPLELYHADAERGAYTDVYSLAATLYSLLTGQVPPSAMKRSLSQARLISPKELNPSISDRTNQAIVRGMALAPEERPQTMQAWRDLLGMGREVTFPWRKWNLVIWLTVISTVAGVLGTIGTWLPILKPSSPPPQEPRPTTTSTLQLIKPAKGISIARE